MPDQSLFSPVARQRLLLPAWTALLLAAPSWAWAAASTASAAAAPAASASAATVVSRPKPPALGLVVKLKSVPVPRAYGAAAGTEQAQATSSAVATERLAQVVAQTALKPRHLSDRGGRVHLVEFDRVLGGDEAQKMAEELRGRADVEWVVPNELETLQQVGQPNMPNDPLFGNQWWLFSVAGSNGNQLSDRRRGVPGLQTAWSSAARRGSADALVAVLDTGLTSHPELAGRTLPGRDFISDVNRAADGDGWDGDPSDPGDAVTEADTRTVSFKDCAVSNSSWHGTSIAGILAQGTNNGADGAGINWNGRVLPVRVAGKCGAAAADIVSGMRWAGGLPVRIGGVDVVNPNPARILNISFGGSLACNELYQETIDELKARDVVVVAAAGNDHAAVSRPASCNNVVAVAALNRDGFKASYSNFGPQVTLSTVGGDPPNGSGWDRLADEGIYTISNTGTTAPSSAGATSLYRAGTSFATPVVSGVLSLMLSVNPNLSWDEMVDGLRRTARPHVVSSVAKTCSTLNPGRCICTTSTCGEGILDAVEALRYAESPTTYQPLVRTGANIDTTALREAVATGQDRPANPVPADDNGGGALGWGWLSALAAAAWAAGRRRTASA